MCMAFSGTGSAPVAWTVVCSGVMVKAQRRKAGWGQNLKAGKTLLKGLFLYITRSTGNKSKNR